MNKLKPRNKICFQNKNHIRAHLNIKQLFKKKWFKLKKLFWKSKKNQHLKKYDISKFKKNSQQKIYLKKKFKNFLDNIVKQEKSYLKKPQEKKKLFKERLFTKQRLKFFYGCIPEYQLKNLFFKLNNKNDNKNIIQKFLISIESRLDVVLYRLRITKTIFNVKQLINHKKIKVNNKIITSQNYILKNNDIISFNNLNIKLKKKTSYNYLEFDYKLKKGIFIRPPFFHEIEYPFPINIKLIEEYLRKN